MASIHMPLLMDLPTFQQHFKHYVYHNVCSFIGDENIYSKYCARMSGNGNADMVAQLKSVQEIDHLLTSLQKTIDHLDEEGIGRIKTVCNAIQKNKMCEFHVVNRWSLCAMTGHQCNRVIEITPNCTINASYMRFVYMYWVLFHMKYIEECRILHFVRENYTESYEKSSISERIDDYMKSSYVTNDESIQFYHEAYTYIHDSLTKTTDIVHQQRQSDKARDQAPQHHEDEV